MADTCDSAFVQPAGKDVERRFVDETQTLVDDHEYAVDVNVSCGQRDFQEVADPVREHDLAECAKT